MLKRTKLSLLLTAVTLLSAPGAHAFENLLIPATNTFDAVRQELWLGGVARDLPAQEEAQNVSAASVEMPEEVTLGLEKWESSL